MTVKEMLKRMSSSEITEWAAIFSLEDEELAKVNKGQGSSWDDDEDITDQLIAAIEADKAERVM